MFETWAEKWVIREFIHKLVVQAVARGDLTRPGRCEDCDRSAVPSRRGQSIEAHHDDYNRPVAVRWLCKACHKQWHVEHEAVLPDLLAYALIVHCTRSKLLR